MSWFSRRADREADLLKSLLEVEARRAEARARVEIRQIEIEGETYEARAKADRDMKELRQRMRMNQQERGRTQGALNARRKSRIDGRYTRDGGTGCPLCDDPQTRNVSVPVILAHRSHETGVEEPQPSTVKGPDIPTELGN